MKEKKKEEKEKQEKCLANLSEEKSALPRI
jgi:hypothetical protein